MRRALSLIRRDIARPKRLGREVKMDIAELLQKANEYTAIEEHEHFKSEIEYLVQNKAYHELHDRFYRDLEFGTGGLRGIIGGGYNRMNSYVVKRATQGLAQYINKATRHGSVVIAYDSRNFADLFALEAAKVFCANGINTYLFSGLRPTPELSFAVRWLKATAGIVITASHNPPEYNGYKVYWSDGAQIVPPHDKGIMTEVLNVSGNIPVMTKEEAIQRNLLHLIDDVIDRPFIDMVKQCSLRPELIKTQGKNIKVIFTPLHGTGAMPVSRALQEMGIDVIFVKEQQAPDGNFPTVASPNPEEASALKLALDLAAREKADLIMGTDPDADRLGIAAPDQGEFRLITGNQLGVLLADYIFSTRQEQGTLPANAAFIKTVVTSELPRLVAAEYGARCYDVLTGFKYIGEKIREFEASPDGPTYIFGGEESYGYLVNTNVRDKDAVSAATMTAELTLYHASQGRSLFDRLRQLWQQFGYFEETLISKTFKGEAGLRTMNDLMEHLRQNPPEIFAGQAVARIKDYKNSVTYEIETRRYLKNIDLPASNVLQFILVDGSVITARPSGTEPKIKFYASCRGPVGRDLASAMKEVKKKILAISQALGELSA
jgi:phosphoglucomutase